METGTLRSMAERGLVTLLPSTWMHPRGYLRPEQLAHIAPAADQWLPLETIAAVIFRQGLR